MSRNYRVELFIAFLLLLLPLQQSAAGVAFTFGYGNKNCQYYLESEKHGEDDEEFMLMVSWLQGYLTAYSLMDDILRDKRTNAVAGIDMGAMIGWVSSFCRANPDLDYAKAAEMLLIKLEKND